MVATVGEETLSFWQQIFNHTIATENIDKINYQTFEALIKVDSPIKNQDMDK